MESEKELELAGSRFKIRRRGFDNQCEWLRLAINQGNKMMPNDEILVSKTQIFDLGNKKWREMTKSDIENLTDEVGIQLWKEVQTINKREVVTEQDFQSTSKADVSSTS